MEASNEANYDYALGHVVGCASLVAVAFRLRDEDALILTLRRLADAVDALERAAEAQPATATVED